MKPEIAIIKSEKQAYDYNKKLCGLYLLERNIKILARTNVKEIYLDLSEEEKIFYQKKIKKHLKKLKNIEIFEESKKGLKTAILISSNQLMQIHYLEKFKNYFSQKDRYYCPKNMEEQFLIIEENDYSRAQKLIVKYIIDNTGGVIAKKINKRISIPISLVLAGTRLHPNYLTVLNMFIGVLSAYFLIKNTYWYIVLGGFFFQLASIFDGVDGEVAKFTITVSKLGGWLDTFSDNTTLLLFLSAISYQFYNNFTGNTALIFIIVMFIALVTFFTAVVTYLVKYSASGSLVAYDKEFLQKLPSGDRLVSLVRRLKYIAKKELFALVLFLLCFTGRIEYVIPFITFLLVVGAISLLVINKKYFKLIGSL